MSLLRIWYCGLVISVSYAGDQRGRGWSVQHAALKHPRTIAQGMVPVDLAPLDGEPKSSRTDPEDASCLLEIHPSFGLASIAIVTRYVMVRAE
jgi:hypothetical protein